MTYLIEKIREKSLSYQQSLMKMQERQQIWLQKTKNLLLDTLQRITKDVPMNWYIGLQEYNEEATQSINIEAVSLHLQNTYSGIVLKTIDSVKSYVKYGGTLSYAQTYNRSINVTIYFPYIEQWVEKKEPLVLGNFEPEEIEEALIIKHIERFLSEMTSWESNEREPIGFIFAK
ncbi:MAG: hypothetical protein OHK0045_12760 [Raineya sp.]